MLKFSTLSPSTHAGPSLTPVIRANDDSYTIRAVAGLTSRRSLSVLQNDTGSGSLALVDVSPVPAGASAKGRVVISADKQSIEYAIDFDGRPFVEAFSYRVQDGNGATSSARVEVAVGEWVSTAVWVDTVVRCCSNTCTVSATNACLPVMDLPCIVMLWHCTHAERFIPEALVVCAETSDAVDGHICTQSCRAC